MKNLKLSNVWTSNYPFYKYSLDYALDSLEKIGAQDIEFYAVFPHFHIDDIKPEDAKSLKNKLKTRGLRARCFTPEQCNYPVNVAAIDPVARSRSLEIFEKSIQCAAELEAELVVLLCGYGTLDEDEKEVWERSVEAVGKLARFAGERGITLVLETSPREYTTTHNSKDVVRMIETVASPAVMGMIDTATLGYSGESIKTAADDLGRYLRHVHVADGVPNGHLIIGEGNLDIKAMLEYLDVSGYKYGLSLEILNDKYMRTPGEAMEKSYKAMLDFM